MSAKLPGILTANDIDRTFVKEVEPDWESLATCIQCGTCSASCPANEAMDFSPRQLWEMLRLGLQDEVANSRTFWLCTQCYACQVRCPRGIDIAETMRTLVVAHPEINFVLEQKTNGSTHRFDSREIQKR